MKAKSKQRSELEICTRCHEIADLQGKKICYWCELEANAKGQDVYDLPENCRVSTEDMGDEL
jgi:hypothetical protein